MPPERTKSGPSDPATKTKSKTTAFKPPRRSGASDTAAAAEPVSTPAGPDEGTAQIPPALVTRLVHTHFGNEDMRMAKDADKAVGRYLDIFVREAVVRAIVGKKEKENGKGDVFLEVRDERAAGQE
jgi:hypothetical protein